MRTLTIPPAFHEILGTSQRPWQLAAIVALALGSTVVLALAASELWSSLAWWRRVAAFVLVLDIVAGCLANFTRGTNDHYAASARRRTMFLAAHAHLPLLHWALGQALAPALVVWAYAIAGAAAVTAVKDRETQLFAGAALLVVAIVWTIWLQLPAPLLAVHLLFVLKLVLSFAVNHHGPGSTASG